MNLSVRKARMGDIRAIHALLMTSSADGLLLPRSLTELYGHLRDFFVAEAAARGKGVKTGFFPPKYRAEAPHARERGNSSARRRACFYRAARIHKAHTLRGWGLWCMI